jgi:anaerobic selenocysteine-containing dehydrogenase
MARGSRVSLDEVKRQPRGALFPDPQIWVLPKRPDATGRLNIGHPEMMTELGRRLDQAATTQWHDPGGYDFRLITRRMMHVHNSTYNVGQLKDREGFNPLFVHPDDMEQVGIATGDLVRVASPHHEIVAIARADASMRRGVVSISHNFGDVPEQDDKVRAIGTNVNRLISVEVDFDPYTGMPKMSAIPVRLEPASGPAPVGI